MKVTKTELKQIIKEEIEGASAESELGNQWRKVLTIVNKQAPELRDKMLRIIAQDVSYYVDEYSKQA